MSDLAPVGPASLGPIHRESQAPDSRRAAAEPRPSTQLRDQVELSDRARYLDRLRAMPDVRAELVNSIRDRIEAGEYPAQQQLDVALDRLIADVQDMTE